MDAKQLYTTSIGRQIISIQKNLSLFLHGRKKTIETDLYIGDLLLPYEGQPTISQYYIAARYLDAKLVKKGIFNTSYCEELSKAYRGTANSKEKTVETMKKFKTFLDSLEKDGFNPKLGRFSIASDPNGLFFDDGTHRLAGLLLNNFKYIPVRIEERKTKYDLNGRELLENSSIDKGILKEIQAALEEIRSQFAYDLFVMIRKDQSETISGILSKYGILTSISLSNPSVNEKVRENELSPEIWGIYYKYKDIPCSIFRYSICNNSLYLNKRQINSKGIDKINREIPFKDWGIITHSVTKSIETQMCLSRLNTTNWSNKQKGESD